jgi:hypothetical protein
MLVLVLILIISLVVLIVVLPIVIVIFVCSHCLRICPLTVAPRPFQVLFLPIIPVAVVLFIGAVLFVVVVLCLREVCEQLLEVGVVVVVTHLVFIVLFLVILRVAPSRRSQEPFAPPSTVRAVARSGSGGCCRPLVMVLLSTLQGRCVIVR